MWKDWKSDVKNKNAMQKKNLSVTGGGPGTKSEFEYLDDQLFNIMESNYEDVVLPPPESWEKKILAALLPDSNVSSASGLQTKAKKVQVN